MSSLKKLIPVAVAAVTIAALAACSEQGHKPSGTPVLKVNDRVITQPQVDRAVQALIGSRNANKPLAPEQMKQATAAALEQLTSVELLYEEGKKQEIKDLDQLVEQQYAKNKEKFPTQAEYEKALKATGMTEADVRDMMRKEIVVNKYIETQFFSKAACSDAEAQKFYDDNKAKLFQRGEQLNASHILVSVDQKGTPDEKKKAREKAEALLKRVKAGEDFNQLASKESTCPSRAVGGNLGMFGRGQMTPPFEKAAYALQKGEVSPVIETEFGYHIIKLQERVAPATDKFEDVKPKIVQYLKQEKTKKTVESYVAELRKKAKIGKV